MSEQKEKLPVVKFRDEGVLVIFNHYMVEDRVSAEWRRLYYQRIFSQRAGREIPLGSIELQPEAGERWRARTGFLTKLGGELYQGLNSIRREDPESLILLVDQLREYRRSQGLLASQDQLLGYVTGELGKLIAPKSQE